MSQDLRNFLIGVGVAFLILFLIGTSIFGAMFLYQMGKNSTTTEVVTAVEKVGVTATEAKDAAIEAKNSANAAKNAAFEAMDAAIDTKDFVKEIAAKEPAVKVVRIKPDAPKKQDSQDQSAMIKSAVNDGLVDVKKSINDLGARMDRLDDGQARIEKRVGDIETRMNNIETDVNKMTSLSDINARISLGEEGYKKMKRQQMKEREDCSDLSGNK